MVGLDGSQPLAQALASLPQQLEGVGGGALRGGSFWISPVFFEEVSLQGCGDFIGRLQRVVDSPVPCGVVNHAVSMARQPRQVPAWRAEKRVSQISSHRNTRTAMTVITALKPSRIPITGSADAGPRPQAITFCAR